MGDMLSQAEIDALLGGSSGESYNNDETNEKIESTNDKEIELSNEKLNDYKKIGKDVLQSVTTTLNQILKQPINIDQPVIEEMLVSEVKNLFTEPDIGIIIKYIEGLEGSNVLVLSQNSGKIIYNLMMGGNGLDIPNEPLTDIDISAVSETMNQVTGALSTVLFKIIGKKIDIGTPKYLNSNGDANSAFISEMGFEEDKEIVLFSYNIKVGELFECKMFKVIPKEYALTLIQNVDENNSDAVTEINEMIKNIENNAESKNMAEVQQQEYNNIQSQPQQQARQPINANQNPIGGGSMSQQQYTGFNNNYHNVNAQPAQFQNFEIADIVQQKENISIIMDVPLEVTVEMGRTYKKIEEILEFSPGTIIELEKLAGDPIDILVNGKFVAKGEVVVIDENYGVRITDIINLKNRI